jgi:hypothetical protein
MSGHRVFLTPKRIFKQENRMERIYRKGFGFCSISHKSFQTYRIINKSSSVRSVVNSAGFGFNKFPPPAGAGTARKTRPTLSLKGGENAKYH